MASNHASAHRPYDNYLFLVFWAQVPPLGRMAAAFAAGPHRLLPILLAPVVHVFLGARLRQFTTRLDGIGPHRSLLIGVQRTIETLAIGRGACSNG